MGTSSQGRKLGYRCGYNKLHPWLKDSDDFGVAEFWSKNTRIFDLKRTNHSHLNSSGNSVSR